MKMPDTKTEAPGAEPLPTKTRILLAAESLFADRGVDAVSFREIASAAGQQNTNAVQYHFKTKDRLLQSIFLFRVGLMSERRSRMLAEAEQLGLLGDARTLMQIVFLPQRDLVNDEGRHTYAAFLAQYLTRYQPAGILHAVDTETPETSSVRRLRTLILQRVSYLPEPIADSRLALATLSFANMLVRWDNRAVAGRPSDLLDDLVEDTLDVAVAILGVPYRHRATRHLASSDWLHNQRQTSPA